MIVAWHMVTTSNARRTFSQIKRGGFILPRKMMRWMSRTEKNDTETFADNVQIKHIDLLAGDGDYVFLKLVPYGSNLAYLPEILDRSRHIKRFDFGFGFDAERMILDGAIVRPFDYILIYQNIAVNFANELAKNDIKNIVDEHVSAVRYIRKLGKMNQLIQKLIDYKNENDMKGKTALNHVQRAYDRCIENVIKHPEKIHHEECSAGSDFAELEILWKGPLPIKNAKYIIKEGVIYHS